MPISISQTYANLTSKLLEHGFTNNSDFFIMNIQPSHFTIFAFHINVARWCHQLLSRPQQQAFNNEQLLLTHGQEIACQWRKQFHVTHFNLITRINVRYIVLVKIMSAGKLTAYYYLLNSLCSMKNLMYVTLQKLKKLFRIFKD